MSLDRIKGLDGVLRRLEDHIAAVVKSQGAALYMAANEVMTLAKEHTPLKIGPLQNSGYVSEPEKVGSKVVVEMGFGGVAEDYAIRQHEDMDLIHPNPDRGAKFLENAMDAKRAQIMEDLPLLLSAALMSGTPATMSKEHPSTPDMGSASGRAAIRSNIKQRKAKRKASAIGRKKARKARGASRKRAKKARVALRRKAQRARVSGRKKQATQVRQRKASRSRAAVKRRSARVRGVAQRKAKRTRVSASRKAKAARGVVRRKAQRAKKSEARKAKHSRQVAKRKASRARKIAARKAKREKGRK